MGGTRGDESGSSLWLASEEGRESDEDDGRRVGFLETAGGELDRSEAPNRSSLSRCPGASPLGLAGEGSGLGCVLTEEVGKRSPPLRGSAEGGEPNRSGTSGLPRLEVGFFETGLETGLLGGLEAGLASEAAEEENKSSTCGFFLRLEGAEEALAEEVEGEEKRSSSDSSSSNNPPSFSFGLEGALFFVLSVGVTVLVVTFELSVGSVMLLLGVVVEEGLVRAGPNISPSSGGGLGEPKRLSDRDFVAVACGVSLFDAAVAAGVVLCREGEGGWERGRGRERERGREGEGGRGRRRGRGSGREGKGEWRRGEEENEKTPE